MTVEDWVNYRQYYKIYLNDKDIPSINLLMVIFTTNGKNDLSHITVSCTKAHIPLKNGFASGVRRK